MALGSRLMPLALPTPTRESSIHGPRTRRWALEAADCPELAAHRIARLGVDEARAPYERVRLRPAGSFFLACLAGEGRMWLEGRWQRVTAGQLCLAPPRVLNAFHAVGHAPWVFAWVRYEEPPWVRPLAGADSPLRLRQGAEEMGRAIAGLRAEWEGAREPAMTHHWVSLVQGLAQRFARPWRVSSRVGELWEAVARDLAMEWKLSTLAERCSLSAEHLRRLCLRELGRTPMDHVAYMRMERARHLLETTDDKLEAIAPQVGYRSATVFARAFARCVGMLPSEYRARR